MIGIIDYGCGNLGSIKNMLSYLGFDSQILNDPKQLNNVSKVILPGVGAFDLGMSSLVEQQWIEPLNIKVKEEKAPILGICLGMQLMTKRSEEGLKAGLGWIDAETIKFVLDPALNLKVPHMGWNVVESENKSILHSQLLDLDEVKFYFVHSYFVKLKNPDDLIFSCNYGQPYCAAFQHDNMYGVQFHPEKSHKYGFELMKNFASI